MANCQVQYPVEVYNHFIPFSQMKQFTQILSECGGVFLYNPSLKYDGSGYIVSYAPGDYLEHSRRWKLCTTQISEIKTDQPWRKILRRIRSIFK